MNHQLALQYFESAAIKIVLPNDLKEVEKASDWVIDLITSVDLMEKEERSKLKMGLIEMLSNAVEHGNLEIGQYLKSKFSKEDKNDYFQFIDALKNDSSYRDRKVQLEVKINPNSVTCIITDEGSGFDLDTLPDATTEKEITTPSGKGILMTRQVFVDEIHYNEKGNQVTLIKKISPKES